MRDRYVLRERLVLMKRYCLLLLLLLLLPLKSLASDWEFVDLGSSDDINYINLASMRFEDNGLVYYWKKTLITQKTDPFREKYGDKVYSVEIYARNDCRNAIYQPLYTKVINANGKVIDFFHNTDRPMPISPWSKALELHQYICSRKS